MSEPIDGWPAAVAETHSATVFFVGERAYKLKKPVDLGFLDFSTVEARRAVCHREVELNRRLAPDVYLGVADVHDADGAVCDHLVVMRRMPAPRRLSTLLDGGTDVASPLAEVARVLAALHARSDPDPQVDAAAGATATRRRWRTNTDEMRMIPVLDGEAEAIERIQVLADRYLDGRGGIFEARVAAGRAVDGHGDLLADDIFCLDDGPRVLDCIEFNDRLRWGDGLADAAFLVMDLERLGRPDLGQHFLDAYQEHTGDAWPPSLVHHHVAYRAQVRAKVAAIRAAQGDPSALHEARRLLQSAEAHLNAARVRLVLVGGLPGTGKSTLAAGIGHHLEATVLRSDEIRKERAGVPSNQPAPAPYGSGLYSTASSQATYETMLERARVALALGETVVLDASWTSSEWRSRAGALAEACSADLVALRCEVAAGVAAKRMADRARRGGDPSDATPEIAAAMAADAAPWPTATAIATAGDPDAALARALDAVSRA